MFKVQSYLKKHGLQKLKDEFGINHSIHPELPLVILNYDQIKSPKNLQIVRECRGLTLNLDDWSLVARSFYRFFNLGESQIEKFDFSNFKVQSKEDGSLVVIYHFNGNWHVNTRGSFANDKMKFQEFTWNDAICKALNLSHLNQLDNLLDKRLTYVCEFVSPYNKIVRKYEEESLYLIAIFKGYHEIDIDYSQISIFKFPEVFLFHSIDQIHEYLRYKSKNDPTFEGVVIRDKNFNRLKIKNKSYLKLHKIRGNGEDMFPPKNILPFILSGEKDELFTYFPEVSDTYYKYETIVNTQWDELCKIWSENHKIESQKDFAFAILNKTPYSHILFEVRRNQGSNQTLEHLKQKWEKSCDSILKNFKNNLTN